MPRRSAVYRSLDIRVIHRVSRWAHHGRVSQIRHPQIPPPINPDRRVGGVPEQQARESQRGVEARADSASCTTSSGHQGPLGRRQNVVPQPAFGDRPAWRSMCTIWDSPICFRVGSARSSMGARGVPGVRDCRCARLTHARQKGCAVGSSRRVRLVRPRRSPGTRPSPGSRGSRRRRRESLAAHRASSGGRS